MCSSSQLVLFALVSALVVPTLVHCTLQLVSPKAAAASQSSPPASLHSPSLRHKLGPSILSAKPKSQVPVPTPPEEDDARFCTLANFQNCISELWPSQPGSGAAASSGSSPSVETTQMHNGKSGPTNSDRTETTTTAPSAALPMSDLAFPTSYRELQATCSDLKERVRCLDRHSERCFTPEMMQVFGHIVTNAKQFVHDLCDNKRVQSEFLIHAKCFRNISLDEQKCAQEYRDAINIPVSEPKGGTQSRQPSAPVAVQQSLGSQSYETLPNAAKLVSAGHHTQEHQIKELIMQRSCCALQELVLCKRRHVREQCGESAAIFMRDHLPRITNPVLEHHCSAYTYGPGTCDEALYRRRIVDGQLVVQSPYNNPFDRGSSIPSSQHLGTTNGGSNRMVRNQMADSSSSAIKPNCINIFFMLCIIIITSSNTILHFWWSISV